MKLLKIIALTLAVVMGNLCGHAQIEKALKSYNFSRGVEEKNKGNSEAAYNFMQKEIAENPGNAYAYLYLALLQAEVEDYDPAMESLNTAIKKMSKKDKECLPRVYASRAHLYAIAGDTLQSLADFDTAVKINPNDSEVLESRAQLLYELDRYSESDVDYRKIVELKPMSVIGYMGLGRNANARGDYDEAIRQYDKVVAMYEDYSSGYAFRGESNLSKGKYLEAIDDFVKALSIDNDTKSYLCLFQFPQEQLPLVVAKLKAIGVKDGVNAQWPYYTGQLYVANRMYPEAIKAFTSALDIDACPLFLRYMAHCYSTLGEFSSALETINQARQMDPEDSDLIEVKAEILGDSGDIEGAIAEWTRYIEKNPDYFGGYYRRGFIEDNSRRLSDALEDYNMSIMLNPDFAYAYLGKGDILTLQGLDAEAKAAYNKVVEIDTIPGSSSCAMYALLALGQKDRAIDFMSRVIANDTLDCDNYYDGACFYSRLGDFDKSLAHLRKAMELGFRRIHLIYADDDLDVLRATDGFHRLMEEYTPEEGNVAAPDATDEGELLRTEIPFTVESGCASVKCSINGLPLSFIFDTGASDVSMSMLEANFMLKNGYLHKEDIVGTQWYVDANGDLSEGTIVILRNVDFGGLTLNNVRASVVRNQKAPLLLGQSVLGRLGSIEIDNKNKKLIITSHSKSR